MTTRLALDDKPLKEIVRGLYYPDSPYEFSVLPAEILGQVYEQFLGQVIRLTSGGHRTAVEGSLFLPAIPFVPPFCFTLVAFYDRIEDLSDKGRFEADTIRTLSEIVGKISFLIAARSAKRCAAKVGNPAGHAICQSFRRYFLSNSTNR